MKKVIFLSRFQKSPNDPAFQEMEDDLRIQSLTNPDFDKEKEFNKLLDRDNKLFEYQPIMIDLKDVSSANAVDGQHTHIVLYSGNRYTIKINFDKYITIYGELTGYMVYDFSQADDLISLNILQQPNGK